MTAKTLYFIEDRNYTKDEVGAALGINRQSAAKRMRTTPQPWTWAKLKREKYRPPEAKYRIDGKTYTIKEVAAELELTPHAARGRIYERLETHGKLSWDSLRRNMRGATILRNLLVDKPAAAFVRAALNKQYKTIAWLALKLDNTNKEFIRRVTAGERTLTPEMARRMAEVLMLDADEEKQLQRLGAKQAGWDV